MNNIKEESLMRALDYCFIDKLPEKEDGKNIWIRAIAEVEKKDGNHSYVYIEKDVDTLDNIVKADFGRMTQIRSIVSYHPFCYLDAAYLPEFKTKGKDERVAYLNAITKEEHKNMTLKELDKEILKLAVKKQLNIEKRSQHAKRTSKQA